MPTHIALLRGINVGGHKMVAMADVRALLEGLGFTKVRSLLQSGNLVFDSDGQTPARLEELLEAETASRLGLSVSCLIRTAAQWKRIVERNPFATEAERDPGHLLVMLLKTAPSASDVKALQASVQGPELIRADGKQLYLSYPAGIGRSKLTGAVIEQKLRTRGSARNWNTVLKLAKLSE